MIRTVLRAISTVMALSSSAGAQSVGDAAKPIPQQVLVRREVPPPQRMGDTADLDLRTTDGLPTVAVTINGQGPFQMAVDTGASGYLRLSPGLVTKLQLEPIGEARASDPSGRNPVAVKLYQIESLKLGGIQFSAISASALSLPGRSGEIDGVIGIGFFRDLLLTLDYGRGRLIAREGALPAANGRDILDIEIQPSGLIVLPVTVGSQTFRAHLDTGNTRQPIFVAESDAKALPVRGEPKFLGVARTVSQQLEIHGLELTVPVKIGNTILPIKEVAYPAIRDPNLGSKAFAGMAVTIDTKNRRAKVVPSRPTDGDRI